MNLWDATLDWLFAESPFKVCQDWVRHAKRCFDYDRRLGQIGTGTQFRYDGRGNRLSVTRAGSETLYVYDPWGNLLAAWDGTGLRKYIYGVNEI